MLMLRPLTLSSVDESLGDRVRRLREAAGLQQKDLAAAARVTESAISQIEGNSTKEPGAYKVLAIARALGTTVEELLDPRHSVHEPHARFVVPRVSPQARQLALWYDDLDYTASQKFVGVLLTYGPAVSNERVSKFLKPAPQLDAKDRNGNTSN